MIGLLNIKEKIKVSDYIIDKHNGEYVLVSADSSKPTVRLGTDQLEVAKVRAKPYMKFI
jgi:hypothetical protein